MKPVSSGGDRPSHGHVAVLGRETVNHSVNEYVYIAYCKQSEVCHEQTVSWLGQRKRVVVPIPLHLPGSQPGL